MRELSLGNCRIDKRYDVVEILGRGSYAEIFVARDTLASTLSPHSLVVIKALNVFLQDDLDAELERTLVENFQNEAIALDRVRHPNVISRLGHGTARDLAGTVFHYLVLEYMEGGDLQKASRAEHISLKKALHYCEQVCAGLRHAHQNGIIHRDIKPQNLLLSKDRDVVKIADFGVARIHQNDAPITRVGTNVYAPPEHSPFVQGGGIATAARLSPASDIYSLAKSLYAIVTGEAPRFYTGQPITDLPISSRNEEWAPDLKRVLNKATRDDPAERHQSIDEFWADLEGLRRFAADFETATTIRPKLHQTPQANVAKGYTPLAPQQPRFNTSRELKLKNEFAPALSPLRIDVEKLPNPPAIIPKPTPRVEDYWPEQIREQQNNVLNSIVHEDLAESGRRSKRRVRRLGAFVLVLVIFATGLYATSVFLRGSGILDGVTAGFSQRTGRANTDINLRPEPSADNRPIGLVTKDSRVRILRSQDNWYQVEIIEQGRALDPPLSVNKGWLHGRYVSLD
ncbi:MAG: protein kinase [Pyrinomonadaceae bacterium]